MNLAVDFASHLGMGFFSSQTRQFMQVLISETHAVIRSTCAQLPFVLVSNDTCCSVVTAQARLHFYGFSVNSVSDRTVFH